MPCLVSVLRLVAVLADVLPADGGVGATFAETEAHAALTDVERQPGCNLQADDLQNHGFVYRAPETPTRPYEYIYG